MRLLFQQQSCHLSLFVHGIEPTIESKGDPTFCQPEKQESAPTALGLTGNPETQQPDLQGYIQYSMSCMLLYYSSIPLLTPDCHFTDQTLLSLLCTGPAHLCVRSLSQQQSSHTGKSSWGPEMQTPKVTKWGEEPNPGSRGFGPVCALKGITG